MTNEIIAGLDKELAESGIEDISSNLLGDALDASNGNELPEVPPAGTEKPTLEKASEPKAEAPKESTPKERYSRNTIKAEEFKQREKHRLSQDEEIQGIKSNIAELTSLVKKSLEAKPEDKQAAVDELTTYATENNLDADKLGKLTEIMEKRIMGKIPKIEAKVEESRDEKWEAHFNNEWEHFSDELVKEYPKMTLTQMKEAKQVMDEVSHSKEWKDYPLDYVYFKNQQKFQDVLFSPSKKSAEPSRVGTRRGEPAPYDWDGEINTPEQVAEAEKQIYALAGNDTLPLMYDGQIVN